MFSRFRGYLGRRRFSASARAAFGLAPVELDPASKVCFITQLCRRDILMYVVALKSLARFLAPREVIILDDGSLDDASRETLNSQVLRCEILRLADVENSSCPKGNCWERLLLVLDRSSDKYLIQMDADTITLERPEEVIQAVEDGRSFTLGTSMGRDLVTLQRASKNIQAHMREDSTHVQVLAESVMEHLPLADTRLYVRGSAGFAGFAPGAASRARLEEFSRDMASLLPAGKWFEWGSEQVASNYMVANSPRAMVLPFPKYGFHAPKADVDSARFLHFIGSWRFEKGTYARLARRVISECAAGRVSAS